jgi:hypothetical protein
VFCKYASIVPSYLKGDKSSSRAVMVTVPAEPVKSKTADAGKMKKLSDNSKLPEVTVPTCSTTPAIFIETVSEPEPTYPICLIPSLRSARSMTPMATPDTVIESEFTVGVIFRPLIEVAPSKLPLATKTNVLKLDPKYL